jgi:subtilisin-like proprotein convertase family protein
VNWLLTLEFGNCSVSGTATLQGETNHSGITVQALPGGGTTTTAADGSYSLPGLFSGTYQIIASKEGWSREIQEVTLSDAQQMTDVDFLLMPVFMVESCENLGLAIPDNNPTGVTSTTKIVMSGEISAVEVFVDITHTYIGDLIVRVTSPGGESCLLHNRTGGSTANLYGWYPLEIEPAESLDRFIGDPMEGEWMLTVSDHAGADTGTLNTWCLRITYAGGAVSVAAVSEPPALALSQSFPNPFSRETQIRFALPREMEIDLSVYDISGRRVATIASGKMPAGHHSAFWAGRDGHGRPVASGVYFYRLVTDERTLTRKMLRLK